MVKVDESLCVGCGACESTCPVGAIEVNDAGIAEGSDACVDCGACVAGCPTGAITPAE